jgi:hypothetical protein
MYVSVITYLPTYRMDQTTFSEASTSSSGQEIIRIL